MKEIILEAGEALVKEYANVALGVKGEDFSSTNITAREEVWELCKKLILDSSDKMSIKVNNPQDVLDAVSAGSCTVQEGKELMLLFKQMKDIETADKPQLLGGTSGGGGLNITINTSSTEIPEPIQVTEVLEHD